MSSKKMPNSEGEIAAPGWVASTEIMVGCWFWLKREADENARSRAAR
jgi:hypothetical protein